MLTTLLTLWRGVSVKAARKERARRRSAVRRPFLEALEDRCVPSATLDPTFGTGGIGTTSLPGNPTVLGDLLQPNGGIIAYGTLAAGAEVFLVRYTPSGSLDTTFGSSGIVETTTTLGSDPGQAALQANGQIVFVDGGQLFRYDTNGSLDANFGSRGIVTFPSGFIGAAGSGRGGPGLLVLPSNGDIVVSGLSGSNSALLAYTPNGSLDSTFGSGGEVLTPGGSRYTSLALENGDIVAGGLIASAGTGTVARYTLSGSLDSTFGSGGIATVPGKVRSLVVQPNGQIVAVGNEAVSNNLEWALARFNVNGTLDTTFGSSSVVTSNPTGDDEALGSALESDGLIVVAGLADLSAAEFGVYNPNGSPAANFGSGGFVTTSFWSSPDYAGDGIVIQPNGDLVVASSDGTAIALARYLPPAPQTSPSFTITGPTAFTAGTTGTFTLTTLNPDGSADTSYSGTVQITSSDPQAVLPSNVTITGGTGTFNVTLKTAGTQSVGATDTANSSINGNLSAITVTPTAVSQVVFTPAPSNGTAGQPTAFQVAVEDAYGNIETGDMSDKITVSVHSGPSTQVSGTLTELDANHGSATFSDLVFDTSGNYTMAAVATLASGGTLGPAVSPSFIIASPVSIGLGTITYNSKTKLYSETVTLTNTSGSTLTGPMSLELTNVPSAVELTDSTGDTNDNPYVRFLASGKTLKNNASVSITLTFTAASLSDISFGTEVVVGL